MTARGTDARESIAPAILTRVSDNNIIGPRRAASRINLAAVFRRSSDLPHGKARTLQAAALNQKVEMPKSQEIASSSAAPSEPAENCRSMHVAPPLNGSLAFTPQRQSDSSHSDASLSERVIHRSPTNPKKSHITTPFLKLRRNKKKASEPLFPLTHLQPKNLTLTESSSSVSLAANNLRPSSSRSAVTSRALIEGAESSQTPQSFVAPASIVRGGAHRSGQSSPTRANFLRGRSSTMSSAGRDSADDHLQPPTARTSTSTGRKSFGDLFGLGRIRQNSELGRQGSLTPLTPGSVGSKSNSLQLPRDTIVLPERQGDEESPAKYLARIEGIVSRGAIASAISKGNDSFSAAVLRSYMRSFSFFGDPMDMAIRKLLMEAELPKETQQIDRCLQAFANRYHECNPGIYSSPDQAYFIAFSLLILHTDVFNKNNKHKMQKSDYLKNTRGEGIFDDILECFYDNISYTPFIHVEDDLLSPHERTYPAKSKRKQMLSNNEPDPARKATKEPIDPYTLIIDGNLDALRPNLKEAMPLDDHYTYLGTRPFYNLKDLQNTFFKTGVLQIVSARSRPDAFMSERTATNPNDAHPGIVDIKVTKVGLLWRKEAKKRKTRSPWQEWGAILTGAQLYFFRNTSWVKNLMHQLDAHVKNGHDGMPVIFKPPLEEFKPDALVSTHAAVALVDTMYKKHKNAFVYVRQGGLDETLLADSEDERNDWLAKLNYAAAFRTSGIRMRGVVGANYDGQGRRGIRRLDSSDATQLVQTPTGPVSIVRGHIDHKMAEDIQAARRDGMQQKILEANNKLDEAQKHLEEQMRNARHLQILAPIQPRTREKLLLAAARLSAQMKWTRMDIWREKCHRDILMQDLADDEFKSSLPETPSASSVSVSNPRPALIRLESKSKSSGAADTSPSSSQDSPSRIASRPPDIDQSTNGSTKKNDEDFIQCGSRISPYSNSSGLRAGRESVPSAATSRMLQLPTSDKPIKDAEKSLDSEVPRATDDIDANERDFLKQAGLWEARSRTSSLDKTAIPGSAEDVDMAFVPERDKLERSKIRRSLQRTLRESAGHLSHHRSKRGRDASLPGSSDNLARETILSRGSGSFVVHGKKASVINLGTELQTLSQEEKILSRKQQQAVQDQPSLISSLTNEEQDDDFQSALEAPSDSNDSNSRRGSAASASTATARSFRELHRKYSSAQAARSVSGARLAAHSDGESERAVSVSDGQRSFQFLVEKQPDDETEVTSPGGQDSPRPMHTSMTKGKLEDADAPVNGDAGIQREHEVVPDQSIAVK